MQVHTAVTELWHTLLVDAWAVAEGVQYDLLRTRAEMPTYSIMPEVWYMEEAPALARKINIALAINDVEMFQAVLDEIPAALRACYADPIETVALCMKYTRCFWTGRQPRGVRNRLVDVDVSASQCQLIAAHWLRYIRQTLGFYARLTRKSGTAGSSNLALEKFAIRVTEKPSIKLAPLYSAVSYAALKHLDLTWLTSGNMPEGVCFHHGPGAVAEGYKPSEKGICHKKKNLGWVYEPYFRNFFVDDDISQWFGCEDSEVAISRAVAVPKDYRGPRIIACEPALSMYVQQGVKDYLYRKISKTPLCNTINFSDQGTNQRLALHGSYFMDFATLDLSDASDTVRVEHVLRFSDMLWRLKPYLLALRTPSTVVLGKTLSLTSYATMGSALCFPIESIVFTLTIVSALWTRVIPQWMPVTHNSVKRCCDVLGLHCYGDDIILRREYAEQAIQALLDAGFAPNRSKCCISGHFRESCGCDAFFGHDVTPLRPRRITGADRGEVTFESQLAAASNMAERGYLRTATWLYSDACRLARMKLPVVPSDAPIPGALVSTRYYNLCDSTCPTRWSHRYQTRLVRVPRFVDVKEPDKSDRRLAEALGKGATETPFEGYPSGRIRKITAWTPTRVKPCCPSSDLISLLHL